MEVIGKVAVADRMAGVVAVGVGMLELECDGTQVMPEIEEEPRLDHEIFSHVRPFRRTPVRPRSVNGPRWTAGSLRA